MNKQQNMRQALKMMQATGVANWTTEELKAIDKKILHKMARSNGDATVGIPEEIKKQMKAKGFSDLDRKHAMEMLETSEEKSTAHSRPEAFLNTNGGRMHYKPDTVVYTALSGEVKERANSPIPAEFGEAEARSNVIQVAALCSQFVSVQAGEWKSSVNLVPYVTHFKGTELNTAALPMLTTKICVILNEDNVWDTLPLVIRAGVTGIAAMVFVRQALNRCSRSSYDVLNTSIVCDLFRVFQKVGQQWIRVMKDKKTPLLPDSMYEVADCDDETFEVLQDSYPGCYRYLGGELITPYMPEADGTLSSALRAAQRMRELQGPSDSTTAILAGMRGYSGLTDEFGKRVQSCVSIVLYLWSLGRKVDLQLLTVGDISIFQSSFTYWRSIITNKEKPLAHWNSELACDLIYLLPGVEDMQKIPQAYRSFIRDYPRDDAVSVHWTKVQLPTAEEKKKVIDYDKSSELIVPRYAHPRDFVAFTTIFGAIPFPQDPLTARRVQQSLCPLDWYQRPDSKKVTDLYVYKHSNCSGFRGILSTIADLHLVGHGYPLMPDLPGRDLTRETLHFISLERVATESAWYEEVCEDASLQAVSFMAPRTRYSPISNLLRMSKNALVVNRATLDAETGSLVGNFAAVKNRTVVGANVSDWGKRKAQPGEKPEPLPANTKALVGFQMQKASKTNFQGAPSSSSQTTKAVSEEEEDEDEDEDDEDDDDGDDFPDQIEEEEIVDLDGPKDDEKDQDQGYDREASTRGVRKLRAKKDD